MPPASRVHSFLCVAVLLVAAAASARCGSGSTSVLAPSEQRCTLAVSPDNATASAEGGTGTITVTTSRECQWTSQTAAGWIHIGSASGQGTGSISYEITANRSTEPRTAVVAIGDVKATITQQAANCAYSASPSNLKIGPEGGDFTVSLSTEDFCGWTTTSQAPWVTLLSKEGKGGGEIRIHVDANTGSARHGVIAVGPLNIAIDQDALIVAACKLTVSPAGPASVPSTASTLDLVVTAQGPCAWTAVSSQSWMTVAPGSGSSSGTVHLTIQSNTGPARSAVATVAGQSVTVNQAAAPAPPAPICGFAISPNNFNNVPSSGGNVTVAITTTAGCAWTVTGNPAWITVSKANGSGSGNTVVTVQSNTGAARNASVQIAGNAFPVTQQALVCTYSVSPASFNVSDPAQNVTIVVTTQAGCTTGATASVPWLHVNSTPPAGGGNIVIHVDKNSGTTDRTGDITVTGLSFTKTVPVTQAKR
jgi:hypothetical protein